MGQTVGKTSLHLLVRFRVPARWNPKSVYTDGNHRIL